MDSFVLKAIREELTRKILHYRIRKVSEIHQGIYLLPLWGPDGNRTLLLSCNPSLPGIHLIQEKGTTISPDAFCRILRQHITGGIIRDIQIPYLERFLTLTLDYRRESGLVRHLILILEIMGRRSNIVLADRKSQKILGMARSSSRNRQPPPRLHPGGVYIPPPGQGKIDPETVTDSQIPSGLSATSEIASWIVQNLAGIGPVLASEMACRAGNLGLTKVIRQFMKDYREARFSPGLYKDPRHGTQILSAIDLTHLSHWEKTDFPEMNLAAERHRRDLFLNRFLEERKKPLLTAIRSASRKQERKKEHLLHDLERSREMETVLQKAEWLSANLYRLKKGMGTVRLHDPSGRESRCLTVKLNPELTPGENAQRYFRIYHKLKRMRSTAKDRLVQVEEEIRYLHQVLLTLNEAMDPLVLDEIREELQNGRYMKAKPKGGKKKKPKPAPPLCFLSSEGHTILVGRNNHGNDRLVTKIARGQDLWFHAHQIPGAHVLLRNPAGTKISETVLREAALLAAYFSRARNSTQVPVCYTFRKYLRKPAGAKPGMVRYTHEKTLFVTPDEDDLPPPCSRETSGPIGPEI